MKTAQETSLILASIEEHNKEMLEAKEKGFKKIERSELNKIKRLKQSLYK